MNFFDTDKWREILSSLRRHQLRTILTMLAVWWGIFMLVILLGAGTGLQNGVEYTFRDDAVNSLWVYGGKTSQPYKGLPAGRHINFKNKDYEHITEHTEGLEHTTGRYYLSGEYFIKRGNKTLSFDVRSVHPGHLYIENTIITKGRFINDLDLQQFRKVAVIGTKVVEGFFEADENPIGTHLNVKGIDFKIVGIFTDKGHENELRKIYLPITTAQKVYGGRQSVDQMMMTLGDATVAASRRIEQKVRLQLAALHKFSPKDENAIWIRNAVENFQEFQTVFLFIKAFIWFVGIGSIIAGVIGVSNIMLIIVKERTKEIGIRKALGATPRSIISMIVAESMFLTALAGYLGLASGVALIFGINRFMLANNLEIEFFRNPEVNIQVVLSAVLLLVVCGVVAGLIPALQAVKINPVQAMKDN